MAGDGIPTKSEGDASNNESRSATAESVALAAKEERPSGAERTEVAGPRSRLGKKRASHNAVTHGIFADILLSGDDMKEARKPYLRLLTAVRRAMRPADPFADIEAEKLAFLYLRTARVYQADWRVAPKLFKKLADGLDADSPLQTTSIVANVLQEVVNRKDPAPELLIRYERNLERQTDREISRLIQWRTLRPDSAKPLAEPDEQAEEQEGKDERD